MQSDKAVDPYSSTYLSQLSDGVVQLDLMRSGEPDIALKMALLFFDEIILNITSLVGNPVLYRQFLELREFGNLYEAGVLRPLLRFGLQTSTPTDAQDYAKFMRESATIASLNYDDIDSHARLIGARNPSYVWIDHKAYWDEFNANFYGLLSDRAYLQARKHDEVREISTITDKLKASLKRGEYEFSSISSIYRYLNDHHTIAVSDSVKRVSEFSAQYANANLASSQLSIPDPMAAYLSVMQEGVLRSSYFEQATRTPFQISLSFAELAKLPMSAIIKIRDLPNFKAIRRQMALFRSGRYVNVEELVDMINECLVDIEKVAATGIDDLNTALASISLRDSSRKSYIVVDKSEKGAILIGIYNLLSGNGIDLVLASALAWFAKSYLEPSRSMSKSSSFAPNAIYDFETSMFKIKDVP